MKRISTVAIGAFPLLVLAQSALFYVLPFLVPLLTGAAVALYGAVLSVFALCTSLPREATSKLLSSALSWRHGCVGSSFLQETWQCLFAFGLSDMSTIRP